MDGRGSRGSGLPSAAGGFLSSDGVRLAWGGAGDQRATGTQAGGESQALRQWDAEGGRWGLSGGQWAEWLGFWLLGLCMAGSSHKPVLRSKRVGKE